LVCFILIASYAFMWPKLSQSEGLISVKTSGGH
jgi:hypothetical protein